MVLSDLSALRTPYSVCTTRARTGRTLYPEKLVVEPADPPPDTLDPQHHRRFELQQAKASCHLELTIYFRKRSKCHAKEAGHVSLPTTTRPFGDVRANRNGSRADLRGQSETLVRRPRSGFFVDRCGDFDRLSPDLQLPEVVHVWGNTRSHLPKEPTPAQTGDSERRR